MTLERIRVLIDQALRTEDRTGVAWVIGMEMFDGLARDAGRYRMLRTAAIDTRDHIVQQLDHVADNYVPHEQADTIEKFDENMDAMIEAYERIARK